MASEMCREGESFCVYRLRSSQGADGNKSVQRFNEVCIDGGFCFESKLVLT
jgi:hypothetical protein